MFEHIFGPLLVGNVVATVEDPAGVNPPSTIIQAEDAWRVHVDWSITAAAPFVSGDWKVSVYAESIGGGFEGLLGSVVVPLNAAPPLPLPRNYHAFVNVAGNTLAAGAYRLVTLINYSTWEFPWRWRLLKKGRSFRCMPTNQVGRGQV